MKKLVLVILCAMPAGVGAQSYEHNLRKLEICDMWGQHAVWALEAREKGDPSPPAAHRNMGYLEPIKQYINDEVFTKGSAPTESSARALGLGYCMDNLDRLARDARYRR
jgi:hypothetical protein